MGDYIGDCYRGYKGGILGVKNIAHLKPYTPKPLPKRPESILGGSGVLSKYTYNPSKTYNDPSYPCY